MRALGQSQSVMGPAGSNFVTINSRRGSGQIFVQTPQNYDEEQNGLALTPPPIHEYNIEEGRAAPMIQSPTLSGDDVSQVPNEDVEAVLLKMHSKMKNLESKYLDLANFYKKELIHSNGAGANISRHNNLQTPQILLTQSDRSSKSHFIDNHPYDQSVEKALIKELLKEKVSWKKSWPG